MIGELGFQNSKSAHLMAAFGTTACPTVSSAISVIVPVRNAARRIAKCLRQIGAQDYPHGAIEVIVADGASDDSTADVAESSWCNDIPIRVIRLQKLGRPAALNAAINAARGDFVCRLDVRTHIQPDYIRRCVELIIRTRAANVGGVQVPVGLSLVQKAIGWAMGHPFGVGNAQFRLAKKSGPVDTIYPGFFRRDVLVKVGMFDENPGILSEDSDINQRIRAMGEIIYLDPGIRVGYEPRSSVREQARLYYRYGMARAGNVRKHGQVTSLRQLAAPALTALLAFCAAAAPVWEMARLSFVGLSVVYLVTDGAASVHLAAKNRSLRSFFLLLWIFPSMHFSWGAGFWRGLFLPPAHDDAVRV